MPLSRTTQKFNVRSTGQDKIFESKSLEKARENALWKLHRILKKIIFFFFLNKKIKKKDKDSLSYILKLTQKHPLVTKKCAVVKVNAILSFDY